MPLKYCAVVVSGLADEPNPRLSGRTPLQAARTPALDAIASRGRIGLLSSCPARFEPGSGVGTMTILGYDPVSYYTGRAPLEAISAGIKLGPTDTVFRCNFVTCYDHRMIDPTAGRITDREVAVLAEVIRRELCGDGMELVMGNGYRALLVARDICGQLTTTPPHKIVGRPIREYIPRGSGAERLTRLMARSREILEDHEVNTTRRDLGENPANMVWFWGQGRTPQLPTFAERHGLRGSAISTTGTVRGLSAAVGFELRDLPPGRGGDPSYADAAEAALGDLDERDIVLVHVAGPDGSSHRGNIQSKLKTIEAIDRELVARLVEGMRERFPRHRIAVLPDHGTSLLTRGHLGSPVPFAAAGEGLLGNGATEFSEPAAARSRCRIKQGTRWMTSFLDGSF